MDWVIILRILETQLQEQVEKWQHKLNKIWEEFLKEEKKLVLQLCLEFLKQLYLLFQMIWVVYKLRKIVSGTICLKIYGEEIINL